MPPVILPALRHGRLWMTGGFSMLTVVAIVCLVPQEQLPEVDVSDKFEHLAAFAALGFWFGSIVVRRVLLPIAVALLAFGGLIELLQGAMALGRQADWLDVRADGIGVAIGVLLSLTPVGRWALWLESGMRKVLS